MKNTSVKSKYMISDNKNLLDMSVIHNFISNSYWAKDRPLSIMKLAVKNSVCFGVYHKKRQVGFARVISDKATFAYVADVFILEEHRGKGLSVLLMNKVLNHRSFKKIKKWYLATRDAHDLYRKFGFEPLKEPGVFMEKFC